MLLTLWAAQAVANLSLLLSDGLTEPHAVADSTESLSECGSVDQQMSDGFLCEGHIAIKQIKK